MLTIRKEQYDILGAAMALRFEDQMVAHAAKKSPEKFKAMGEPAAREFLRAGIKKGMFHEIEAVCDLFTLVDLMWELGLNFELSPEHLRALEMLANKKRSAQARIDLIYLKLKGRKREA